MASFGTFIKGGFDILKNILPSLIGTGVSGAINYANQNAANKANVQLNNANNETQKQIAANNLDFQREQFNYQKYLNANQTQIQASDALKAGINPLAMHGQALSSGSFTGSSANTQSPEIQASQFGDMGNLITDIMSQRTQRKISSDSLKSQEAINAMQIASNEKLKYRQMDIDSTLQKDEQQFQASENEKDRQLQADIEANKRKQEQLQFEQQLLVDKDEANLKWEEHEYSKFKDNRDFNESAKNNEIDRLIKARELWEKIRNPDLKSKSGELISDIMKLFNLGQEDATTLYRQAIGEGGTLFDDWYDALTRQRYHTNNNYHSKYTRAYQE